jgi:uncharacterized metal-binding protein YceD (DUF177 family)
MQNPTPEFSRPFAVDRLGGAAWTETIAAIPEERAALAKRLRLPALNELSATVRLERQPGGLIQVSGRLQADVVQTCVVTLADFPSHVEDSFSLDFGDAPADFESDEINLDIDHDPPEPIEAGAIDIGELVAQYLSLALDPHPRAPGAALDPALVESDEGALSPFAVLKQLKQPT